MNKTLEDLWLSYLMENRPMADGEYAQLQRELVRAEDALRASLSETQRTALTAYDACLSELYSRAETDAFVKGIRFAVRFLMDALGGD